jgi:hypothetical protein
MSKSGALGAGPVKYKCDQDAVSAGGLLENRHFLANQGVSCSSVCMATRGRRVVAEGKRRDKKIGLDSL